MFPDDQCFCEAKFYPAALISESANPPPCPPTTPSPVTASPPKTHSTRYNRQPTKTTLSAARQCRHCLDLPASRRSRVTVSENAGVLFSSGHGGGVISITPRRRLPRIRSDSAPRLSYSSRGDPANPRHPGTFLRVGQGLRVEAPSPTTVSEAGFRLRFAFMPRAKSTR